jgi:hypothetical protein
MVIWIGKNKGSATTRLTIIGISYAAAVLGDALASDAYPSSGRPTGRRAERGTEIALGIKRNAGSLDWTIAGIDTDWGARIGRFKVDCFAKLVGLGGLRAVIKILVLGRADGA